jgi:uncharacterized membrane protein
MLEIVGSASLLVVHFFLHLWRRLSNHCLFSMYDTNMLVSRSTSSVLRVLVWTFFVIHLLAQPLYSLLPDSLERVGSLVIVVAFALFSFSHLWVSRGYRAAFGLLLACFVVAGGSEVLSVHTGIPYGWYVYTPKLGFGVFGVPVLVPVCWLMMAYPAARVAALIAPLRLVVPVAALALTAWDVFLDPQMVRTGYWVWARQGEYLGIPLENYAGWLVTALVVFTLFFRFFPPQPPVRTDWFGVLPVVAYVWTWFGSSVVNLFWWGQPVVALAGFVCMGVFALPAVLKLRRRPPVRLLRLGNA